MIHRTILLILSAISVSTSIHCTDETLSASLRKIKSSISLIDAVRNNSLSDVAQLLEQGKDLLQPDNAGRIPLHYATNRFNKPISALLLGYGKAEKQLMHTTNKGNSALDLAYRGFGRLKKSDTERPQAKSYIRWLQKKYAHLKTPTAIESHFAPKIAPVIIDLINREETEIVGAMYSFTYYPIAQAMIWKKQKDEDFNVELVIHEEFRKGFCSTLKELAKNRCSLYAHKRKSQYENMHHKFIILSNINGLPLVINGSYNYTGQAEENNQENITVIYDQDEIGKFTKEFLKLKENSHRIKLDELHGESDNKPYSKKMNKWPL